MEVRHVMERLESSARETAPAPRTHLEPYLLLLLRNLRMHGYQLMQSLALLGFAAVDAATVYRTLRQMERDGLVTSNWETGSAGPAKRTYSLTEQGQSFLQTWAGVLEQQQRMLDAFFKLYLTQSTSSDRD